MSRYHDQVATALSAVSVIGVTRYTWLGRKGRSLPPGLQVALNAHERRRYLVSSLRDELYWSFYCHGRPVPRRRRGEERLAADIAFRRRLSDANTGSGSWEPGWTAERLDDEGAVVTRAGLRMRAASADCRGDLRPGATVDVRVPKELPERSPGFYMAIGDAPADGWSRAIRCYWNIAPQGAPRLLHTLTARLNDDGRAFRLKVADRPDRFDRSDVAVLYLPGDAGVVAILRDVAPSLKAVLRSSTPAFTLGLAPGVGLAEDGASSESFGSRRCELLADAIVTAHESGANRLKARLDCVEACFERAGVALDAPYLEPSMAGGHVLRQHG